MAEPDSEAAAKGAILTAVEAFGDVREMKGRDSAATAMAELAGELAGVKAERSDLLVTNASLRTAVDGLNETVTLKDAQLGVRDATIEALRARIAVLEGENPDPPDPPAASVPVMGMSTEDNKWAERVALTGLQNSRRLFLPTYNPAGIIADGKEAKAMGLTPVMSLKVTSANWAAAASGAWDARFKDFGQRLAALDFAAYATLDHEPRGGSIDTPQELLGWSKMLVRAFTIIRAELPASSKVKVGPIDNGHPWGIKWGRLSDAQLAIYYTPELLAASQFLAGDFYDGATDTNVGEPAWVKMVEFEKWTKRIGFVGPLGVGEWNFITGKDCRDTWAKIDKSRWAFIELFNNSANNRDDLPTSINGSWVLVPGTDRAAAYKEISRLALA